MYEGPMFPNAENMPEKAAKGSRSENNAVIIPPATNRDTQAKKREEIRIISSFSNSLPPIIRGFTALLGRLNFFTSLPIILPRMPILSTFIPPPVEPTQPPMNMKIRNTCLASAGKKELDIDLVLNPVVVIIETV